MDDRRGDDLNSARLAGGLSYEEFWIRYFALGGMTAAMELEAILHGALEPTSHDRDRIVHALNERFTELGHNHPVPYSDDGKSA